MGNKTMNDLKGLTLSKMEKQSFTVKDIEKTLGCSLKTAYNRKNDIGTMSLYEFLLICQKLGIGVAFFDRETESAVITREV